MCTQMESNEICVHKWKAMRYVYTNGKQCDMCTQMERNEICVHKWKAMRYVYTNRKQ